MADGIAARHCNAQFIFTRNFSGISKNEQAD
jgi:hypothetical protein